MYFFQGSQITHLQYIQVALFQQAQQRSEHLSHQGASMENIYLE